MRVLQFQAYINHSGLLYPVILELKTSESLLARGQNPTYMHLVFCTSVPHLVPYVAGGQRIQAPPFPPPPPAVR